jgi:hypothetical protein
VAHRIISQPEVSGYIGSRKEMVPIVSTIEQNETAELSHSHRTNQ